MGDDTYGKYLKQYHFKRILMISIIMLIGAILYFPKQLILFESSLIKVNGEVDEIVKKEINNINSFGINERLYNLELRYKNDPAIYYLKDIGNINYYLKVEDILRAIDKTRSVEVWIHKNDKNKKNIQFFQIADDEGNILFSLNDIDAHKKFKFYLLLGLGLLGTLSFVINIYYHAKSS